MKNLKAALSFGGILTAKDIDRITRFFKPETFKSGGEFLSIGNLSNRIGFIDSGILRIYSVGGDFEDVTKYFIQKNQFVMDLQSFYENTPSSSGVQAVTKCRMFSIERMAWNELSEEIPNLYILTKSLTEAALLNKIKTNEFLHFGSAKDKYLEFTRRYPELALYVPLQFIASYLQITPQSLSRIRSSLRA